MSIGLMSMVNILFALLIAPLLDGFERKVRARLQNRQGPPIMQSWYDLIKLFKRPCVLPKGSIRSLYVYAPYVTFASILAGYLIVSTLLPASLKFVGDFIVLAYLLTFSTFVSSLGAFSSGNPYAQVGSNREVSLFMSEELVLAFIIVIVAVVGGGVGFAALFPLPFKISSILALGLLFLVIYVSSARVPFDIPEAEPEIIEGPLIEYSGRHLGLMNYSLFLKRLLLYSLFLNFVLPKEIGVRTAGYLIGLVVLSIIYSSLEAYYGRFRIDQGIGLMKKLSIVALFVWLVCIAGW
ncbi:respiratory chain complex I subunit 1 family protein [Thermococcus sp.]|uniref:respiratory chain complex I subunit 1 family protein n=1 Tax=Thermococcus sp. TaxID=35749 RepID=UPI0019B9497C|nr:NADH-quinone oxidoreductase subunit H [Thermococcus sp.]MBC7095398.1 NADH-quinone oxidoreductase subunit H [Thermococcus sp.]